MTKKELNTLLDALDKWGEQVKDDTRNQAAFKNLKDPDQVPQEILSFAAAFLRSAPIQQLTALAPGAAAVPASGDTTTPPAVQRAEPTRDASVTSFDEFMLSLAQSVVATQKRLDGESAAYLASLKTQPHVEPTVFRMPKVEAQMKFGLEVTEGSKLNLMFWGKNSEKSELNQQGINFEIISAPAPPGAVERARRSAPVWEIVLDPAIRKELIAQVAGQPADGALDPAREAAGEDATNVIFVAVGGDRHLVLYAQDEKKKDVGVWILQGAPAKLEAIYRFSAVNGRPDEEVRMRDLVIDLAKQQREFLGVA